MRHSFLFFLLFLAACAPKVVPPEPLEARYKLAVAGFSQPLHGWDFLSGGMPQPDKLIDEKTLLVLDRLLREAMQAKRRDFQGPKFIHACQELLLAGQNRSQLSAYEYWLEVGRCLAVDYLLIPFAFSWQEREGGEWGAEKPAHVAFELNLMEIQSGRIQRFCFDEKQKSLLEDLFRAGRFFQRGGRWILAEELAAEGLALGVTELGL